MDLRINEILDSLRLIYTRKLHKNIFVIIKNPKNISVLIYTLFRALDGSTP